jgi:hypothetical protein
MARLVIFLSLIIAIFLPFVAFAIPCGFGSEPPENNDTWYPVTPSLLNETFRDHFSIETNWQWSGTTEELDGRWGITAIQDFANLIMSHTDPEAGYAQLVLDLFAEDAYPSSPAMIGIETTIGDPPNGILDYFYIKIYDYEAAMHAFGDEFGVSIRNSAEPIPGSSCTDIYLTPNCVVKTWFVHEWQHICHHYYTRSDAETNPCLIGGGSYNEMCSKYAEKEFGFGANAPVHDLHYDLGLPNTQDCFYFSCMCTWVEDLNHPNGGYENCLRSHHYSELGLFALYLQNNLSRVGIDFFPDWLKYAEDLGGSFLYERDFLSLSNWMNEHSTEYAGLLQGGYGSSDLAPAIELFHKFNAAKFLNLSSPPLDKQLYQWSPTMSPQGFYGLFQDWNDYWHDNVHAYPPYHTVGQGGLSYGPVVETRDFWQAEYDAEMAGWNESWDPAFMAYNRVVHLSSNAANYLVFLPETGNHGTLQLSFFVEDLMPCIVSDSEGINGGSIEYSNFEGLDGISLNIQVWGYQNLPGPVAPENVGLDQYGEDAELIESRIYESASPLDRFEFRIEDFGPDYDAVAVVLSLTELNAFPIGEYCDAYESRAIPYRYTAHVLPEEIVTLDQTIDTHQILQSESIV